LLSLNAAQQPAIVTPTRRLGSTKATVSATGAALLQPPRSKSALAGTGMAAFILGPTQAALLQCHDRDSGVVLAESGPWPTLASSWPH